MADIPRERQGMEPPGHILEKRQTLSAAAQRGVWATRLLPQEEYLNGVRVLRFSPRMAVRAKLLHLHGGGFRAGVPEMLGPFAEKLVESLGVEIICPAYRLAPEHPFPAALLDALGVAKALRQEDSEVPLIISGDSAGGGVAASTTAVLSESREVAADGLILLSPWLDLTLRADAFIRNAGSDDLFSLETAKEAASLYLQGETAEHPLVSPVFALVERFPPTFLCTGDIEVLVDDSRTFARRLAAAGVEVRYRELSGMTHTAVVRNPALKGARDSLEAIKAFLQTFLY